MELKITYKQTKFPLLFRIITCFSFACSPARLMAGVNQQILLKIYFHSYENTSKMPHTKPTSPARLQKAAPIEM